MNEESEYPKDWFEALKYDLALRLPEHEKALKAFNELMDNATLTAKKT